MTDSTITIDASTKTRVISGSKWGKPSFPLGKEVTPLTRQPFDSNTTSQFNHPSLKTQQSN
jgi:hypothetical protein